MKLLKQYGIQRSGTNFMRAVFEMNMDCRVLSNIGGSKHEKITNMSNLNQIITEIPNKEILKIDQMLRDGKIPRIVIIKNPYDWMVSISLYLRQPATDKFVQEQLARYINLNTHWAKECDDIIYYEKLVKRPTDAINFFSEKYNIKRTTQQTVLPHGKMKQGADIPATQNIFNVKFKPRPPYKGILTKRQIEMIQKAELEYMPFLKIPLTTLTNLKLN